MIRLSPRESGALRLMWVRHSLTLQRYWLAQLWFLSFGGGKTENLSYTVVSLEIRTPHCYTVLGRLHIFLFCVLCGD